MPTVDKNGKALKAGDRVKAIGNIVTLIKVDSPQPWNPFYTPEVYYRFKGRTTSLAARLVEKQ